MRNHFQPRLEGWLDQAMTSPPSIFWDRDIEAGQNWPEKLREALAHSRMIVPVLTHPYCRSRWCRAELNTMLARAQLLKAHNVPQERLIRPVRFFGEDFPLPVSELQYEDMSQWAIPQRVFETTAPYVGFVHAIQAFAEKVANCLPDAPPWVPDWPVLTPEPVPVTTMKVPLL